MRYLLLQKRYALDPAIGVKSRSRVDVRQCDLLDLWFGKFAKDRRKFWKFLQQGYQQTKRYVFIFRDAAPQLTTSCRPLVAEVFCHLEEKVRERR